MAKAASVNSERGILRFPNFVLYPNGAKAAITAKPTRILLVKGIPKMVSEVRLKLLFSHFGPIFSINKSGENEYKIEYFDEHYAEKATCLSGYTIKLRNKDEAGYVGNLKMFYIPPEEDFSVEHDLSSPPSKKEFKNLCQKLSNPDTLSEGTEKLKEWLKSNRCSAKNVNEFHSLFEVAFRTSKKLIKDKNRCHEQIKVAEANYRKANSGIAVDLNAIGRIFNHENYDKMADSFPEEERQNLLQWKQDFLSVSQDVREVPNKKKKNKRSRRKQKKQRGVSLDQLPPKDASPSEQSPRDVSPGELSSTEESFSHLTVAEMSHGERLRLLAEKEDLQLQLDAAEANRECERMEHAARYGFLNQSLFEAHMKCREYESQLADWNKVQEKLRNYELESEEEISENDEASNSVIVDTRLITTLAYFLQKRQQGATLSDIRNYLRRDFHASGRYLADLMRQLPALFKEVDDESGMVKWVFSRGEKERA